MINAARNLVKVLILGTSHIDVHAMRCGRIASVLLHNAAGNKFVYAQEALLLPKNGSEESQKDDSDTEEVLEKTKLKGQENKFPHELSGGQQQRVALARAIINKPKI